MRLTSLLLLISAALLGWSMPAQAHTSLVSTDPSEGAQLDAAPQQVVLTFTEKLNEPSEASFVVDGTAKEAVVELDGPRLVVTPSGDLPDGAYDINYRVVSADGHPVTGTLSFTVGEAAAAADDTKQPAAVSDDADDLSWLKPVAVGALIVVGVLMVVLVQRRSRSGSAGHDRS